MSEPYQKISKEMITNKNNLVEQFLSSRKRVTQDKSLPTVEDYITYLAETIKINSKELFVDYISWAKELFASRSHSITELKQDLELLYSILSNRFNQEKLNLIKKYITAAQKEITKSSIGENSFLKKENPYYELAVNYLDTLLNSKKEEAYNLINEAVEEGVTVKDIYLHVFEQVQKEIGRLWQLNELSVATEHYCTSVTQLIMSQLYPHILNSDISGYVAVTTCVGDELHELGVRMIADLLELEGWDTFHIGANTPRADIITTVEEQEADLVCISVTMSKHLHETVKLIEEFKVREEIKTKIMVGGYPFNVKPDLWKEIGADGYASNAEQSLTVAKKLV